MLRNQIIETFNYITHSLFNHPLTYLNSAAIAVSMTELEATLKIILYSVSIVASVLVIRKYLLEIKKLQKEESNKEK
jgi:membrane protein implicated in regulation of membrane protease activity